MLKQIKLQQCIGLAALMIAPGISLAEPEAGAVTARFLTDNEEGKAGKPPAVEARILDAKVVKPGEAKATVKSIAIGDVAIKPVKPDDGAASVQPVRLKFVPDEKNPYEVRPDGKIELKGTYQQLEPDDKQTEAKKVVTIPPVVIDVKGVSALKPGMPEESAPKAECEKPAADSNKPTVEVKDGVIYIRPATKD